ncbi:MAG: bifunctional (p)ppGpp synthetase/guanosine-3',5'-bis(diphosphate) 3'-pyrophosphohydrolase [Proteobacteria bacterium]|nr:bifunctional (p)ppGpp synthetase/guanosine-3',5'-bis(diphosphate) 3'-pyrophosphohydrolase [Pseudomonadota bacterium]
MKREVEMSGELDVVARALRVAEECHRGQTDKAGMPYIEHPKRVAARCVTAEEKAVALLHDTMEDCGMTADRLRELGFDDAIIEGVQSVTKKPHEDYFDFVRRACDNRIGRVVKMHDLEDNMDVMRFVSRCPVITDLNESMLRQDSSLGVLGEKDLFRMNKYLLAYRLLQSMGA